MFISDCKQFGRQNGRHKETEEEKASDSHIRNILREGGVGDGERERVREKGE